MMPHTIKFGTKPISPFVTVPANLQNGDAAEPGTPFEISWADEEQGLNARVRLQENGRLRADVFCARTELVGQAALSVALAGTRTTDVISKLIVLSVSEDQGCSGSADLGPLSTAVKRLGPQLGIVVILSARTV